MNKSRKMAIAAVSALAAVGARAEGEFDPASAAASVVSSLNATNGAIATILGAAMVITVGFVGYKWLTRGINRA